MFLDKQVAWLEVGKDAEIAVWDKNMYTMPPAQLKDLSCELTLVARKAVYSKEVAAGLWPGGHPFTAVSEAGSAPRVRL